MKTKKVDKEFLLTDESVNCYGFRLLTSGYLKDEYTKNPIGYHMHNRNDGVVVRWEDVRMEGDKVYGKPVINLSNPRGQQTLDEIENGFLNGASVGHIVVLESSEDPKMMVPGQTGPTITKWFNRECSLVDVPGNFNALTLYDKEGNVINLADFKTQTTNTNMKQLILTAEQISKIPGLKAEATADEVIAHFTTLKAEADKVPQLTADLATATTAKETAETALAKLKGDTVNDLVDTAVKETRCSKEAGEILKKQFEGKPEDLKALLGTMQPYKTITEQLSGTGVSNDETKKLMDMSAEELFKGDGAERLKVLNLAAFKTKYKEYTGEDYKEEGKQ